MIRSSTAIISPSTSAIANSTPSCGRIRKRKIVFGSAPWRLDDGKLNNWGGGRGVYFRDPNGHVLELDDRAAMTAGNF